MLARAVAGLGGDVAGMFGDNATGTAILLLVTVTEATVSLFSGTVGEALA